MIDYWAPEGTRIQQVAADLKRLEQKLLLDKRVESVNTFIGAGPPRFYLPVSPGFRTRSTPSSLSTCTHSGTSTG